MPSTLADLGGQIPCLRQPVSSPPRGRPAGPPGATFCLKNKHPLDIMFDSLYREVVPGKESRLSAQTQFPTGFLSKIIILGQTSCAQWAPGSQSSKSNLANAGLRAFSAGGAPVWVGDRAVAAASLGLPLRFAFGWILHLALLIKTSGASASSSGEWEELWREQVTQQVTRSSVPSRGREGLCLEPGCPLQGG